MSINYSLSYGADNTPTEGLVIAYAQSRGTIASDEIARHMSDHNSKYDKGDYLAMMSHLGNCVKEKLLEGYQVEIGDLGTYYVTLRYKAQEQTSGFPAAINDVRVHVRPSSDMKSLYDEASFEYVTTLTAQSAAKKAQKAAIDEALGVTSEQTADQDEQTTDQNDGSTEDGEDFKE